MRRRILFGMFAAATACLSTGCAYFDGERGGGRCERYDDDAEFDSWNRSDWGRHEHRRWVRRHWEESDVR